jgi:hypothetical protein
MKNIDVKGFTFRYGYGDYDLSNNGGENTKVKRHVFIGETTDDFTPECVNDLYHGFVSRLCRTIQPYVMEQLEDKPVVYTGNVTVYILHKDNLYLLNGTYNNTVYDYKESGLIEKTYPYRYTFIRVPDELKDKILTMALDKEYIPSYTQVQTTCILKASKENTYLAVLEQADYTEGVYSPVDDPDWIMTEKQIKRKRLDELAGHITKYYPNEAEFLSFIKDTLK